jgi:ABC-2 type transport system permease protein
VAACAPDVLCPDRRQRVLPVLFARPLTGTDYAAAKLAAIASLLFAFSFLPQVVLFVGKMLVSDSSLEYVSDNAAVLWKVPVAVSALALYYAALGLAVASLTSRRVVAGASILGITLATSAVAGILSEVEGGVGARAEVFSLLRLPLLVRDLVFLGHPDPETSLADAAGGAPLALAVYVVVVTASLATLWWRYRWAE